MATRTLALHHGHAPSIARTAAWIGLILVELAVLKHVLNLDGITTRYGNPVFHALLVARWALASVAVFAILVWPERQAFAAAWSARRQLHSPVAPLILNLALFALLAFASIAISDRVSDKPPPASVIIPFAMLLAATALSLLRIDLSLRGLWEIARIWRIKALYAIAAGIAAVLLAETALLAWPYLAPATLHLSAGILSLYEPGVIVDTATRRITVGNFTIVVAAGCGGHEGLALIAAFVGIYLWVFRTELKFPAAFLLFPVGLATIWILNSVRIAALTSLGAHVSPHIAVDGFHSQAGWITFLLVALGLMTAARRATFIQRNPRHSAAAAGWQATPTTRYLLPFVALMLGSMAMSATAPHNQPVYILKVALAALALVLLRHAFGRWSWRISPEAWLAGFVVGAAWIATDPAPATDTPLAAWLAAIGPQLAALWLVARGIGTIVLVPLAEELAFRGYVYRRIIAPAFEKVPLTQVSLLALVVSSALFGLLHDRWLSAALAGAVFASVMLRSGRLSDAVAAHAFANAIIFGWALATRQWSLL